MDMVYYSNYSSPYSIIYTANSHAFLYMKWQAETINLDFKLKHSCFPSLKILRCWLPESLVSTMTVKIGKEGSHLATLANAIIFLCIVGCTNRGCVNSYPILASQRCPMQRNLPCYPESTSTRTSNFICQLQAKQRYSFQMNALGRQMWSWQMNSGCAFMSRIFFASVSSAYSCCEMKLVPWDTARVVHLPHHAIMFACKKL